MYGENLFMYVPIYVCTSLQTTVQAHTMAKYFIELCLLEYSLLCYLPSQIAAASLYISMKLLDAGKWVSQIQ